MNDFPHPCPSLTVCVSCDSCFCALDLGESDHVSEAEAGPACASSSRAGPLPYNPVALRASLEASPPS